MPIRDAILRAPTLKERQYDASTEYYPPNTPEIAKAKTVLDLLPSLLRPSGDTSDISPLSKAIGGIIKAPIKVTNYTDRFGNILKDYYPRISDAISEIIQKYPSIARQIGAYSSDPLRSYDKIVDANLPDGIRAYADVLPEAADILQKSGGVKRLVSANEPWQYIGIKPSMENSTTAEVLDALSHEYLHVGQRALNPNKFSKSYKMASKLYGYSANPYEVTANIRSELSKNMPIKGTQVPERLGLQNRLDVINDVTSRYLPQSLFGLSPNQIERMQDWGSFADQDWYESLTPHLRKVILQKYAEDAAKIGRMPGKVKF